MIYKANFKNYLFVLLAISIFLSCNQSQKTEVIIQGNIVNPMGNIVQLVGPGEMEDGTLSLNFQRETNIDENGNFIDTLNLRSSGYFFFIETGVFRPLPLIKSATDKPKPHNTA